MELGMAGIPTVYGGVQFRSRAEARWAAFFDAVGWPWQYEPIDLDGYIPDFLLTFPVPLLVEVKGEVLGPDEIEAHTAKIDASGWQGPAMLVGAYPTRAKHWHGWDLGVMHNGPDEAVTWGPALYCRCRSCSTATPVHVNGAWLCRACGQGTKPNEDDLTPHWAASGNATQWRGVQART